LRGEKGGGEGEGSKGGKGEKGMITPPTSLTTRIRGGEKKVYAGEYGDKRGEKGWKWIAFFFYPLLFDQTRGRKKGGTKRKRGRTQEKERGKGVTAFPRRKKSRFGG